MMLFNQSFKLPKFKLKNIFLYIASFLIPFLILLALHLFYGSGFGNPMVYTLSLHQICFNGLAGICFLFYVRHTDGIRIFDTGWQLVFSCAYGLCSYGIIQEGSVSALCLYAIFPIVFLSFEKMIDGVRYLPFLISAALMLIIKPSCGLSVFLFLIFLTFLEAGLKGRLSFGNFFHYLGCFALSFLLAAFRIFPYFESVYDGSASYSGYSAGCSPFVLLSRFLPGAAPSISFFTPNGIDLYFGLFFFLSFILFFFFRTISKRKRLFYGFFTLILIASLWLSPVRFLFSLFAEGNSFSVPHSFFLAFWGLKLAMETIHALEDAPAVDLTLGALFAVCLLLACWIGGAHTLSAFALPVAALLFLLWTAFLFQNSLFASQKMGLKFFMFFLILIEFCYNAFTSTNLKLIPADKSTQASFSWNKTVETEDVLQDEAFKEDSSYIPAEEEAYLEFASSHKNDEVSKLLLDLIDSVSMENSEKKFYCNTAFPDQFQLLNGLFQKAGGSGNLFSPFPADITIADSSDSKVAKLSGDIYHFSLKDLSVEKEFYYVPFSIQADSPLPENLYLCNSFTGEFFQLTSDRRLDVLSGWMRFTFPSDYVINFQLSTYVLNVDLAKQIPALTDSYLAETSDNSRLYIYSYAGVLASCIGILIMLTLYMNKDKDKVYQVLFSIKDVLDHWKLPGTLIAHMKRNRIYYLSFFIPIFFFVANMILRDCVPFGSVSFFDEDGTGLTLPSALDTYYSLKDGNTYLSMNSGYGVSLYALNPLIQLSAYYQFFSPGQIAPLLLFTEALCLGLCGVAMVFYMTHRLHGTRSRKEDYRLLVPAMIYALNSYMLAMHNYTSWYITLFAFPLLIAAMDYLMYKKKCLPYILLLCYCIATNLYLALYICIFLAIYFFTCRFHGLKDFMKKGVRFALSSLLAAGNCYFIIANTLQSSYDSGYNKTDAVFPSFGLHTSFLEQWKKHMIFSLAPSISSNNGHLNIYCGILTLLLVLVYFFAKKISWKEKLRRLLPVTLLYISFNGQVLSYLWGGLHYQNNVPNRFAFLLLFLLAELSYDGIRLIRKTSALTYSLLATMLAGFFLICQFLSQGNSSLAWICTLALCAIYLMAHLLMVRLKKQSFYPKLLTLFLIAELCVNMSYITNTYVKDTISLFSDYPAIADAIEENLKDEPGYYRICFPANAFYYNAGQMYHTGSNSLFNSFVSKHQCTLNGIYGFSTGTTNSFTANYLGTPFGLSLSNHRYIFLPTVATKVVDDLNRYRYLGYLEPYYVFENTAPLSLGIYAPVEIDSLNSTWLWQFYNDLASLYTNTKASLLIPQTLEYAKAKDLASDSFYFMADGKNLTYEEAEALYQYNVEKSAEPPTFQLYLNYVPLMSGPTYLYTNEFIPLGRLEAGIASTKEISFPSKYTSLKTTFDTFTMNEEVFNDFISEASKNQLENIEIYNDTITGTTNYEKDGYTMLSLAWDRSWHAYIDGEEVEIKDPYDSFMLIKTPAGKHTLELKYIPYGMKVGKGISLGFWILTSIIFITAHVIRHRKTLSPS